MALLYANENFPLPVVEELRRLGHDVLTTYESGRAGTAIPDDEVLAYSVAAPTCFVRQRGEAGDRRLGGSRQLRQFFSQTVQETL